MQNGVSTSAPYLSGDPHTPLDWRQGLPIYRDHFEQPFLHETIHFYEVESNQFLKSHSVTDYLIWVSKTALRTCLLTTTFCDAF